ncbi:glutamyl-tRNA synthetase [Variovorax sp. W1I1]|nr:glutamyl-tRNA synthetase [Variovorax sp. W1I1]
MTGKVRTRIAPSPTGFLHLGTARTALYSWAYARHHGGEFVLRIEDTDVARSTQDSTDQILASMHWLGLDYDEGPIYQMQRLERYREVIAQMLAAGTAYHCYCTPAELDEMREAQRARGEKTLYDRRWRPEPGKVLPPVPEGVPPVVRFCNPPEGDVTWNDLVKGEITINNREIDDLIILRPDGVPTYNFAVVVDDWDMNITHVFRGDEHINNTPWQINIFRALGAPLPQFGHVPVILGDDGQKLSKRRGAVSVTAYEENGYLPEAMLNYLARLGWSHGDDELFTREQMVSWFDGSHLSKSPAQWDAAKLAWVNAQYIKAKADAELAPLVAAQLKKRGIEADDRLAAICALFKDRCETTVALADWGRGVLRGRDAERSRSRAARHRCGETRHRDAGREARGRDMGKSFDRRGHQGSSGRAFCENARVGHAGSRPCDGNTADAITRFGARTLFSRKSCGAFEKGLIFRSII